MTMRTTGDPTMADAHGRIVADTHLFPIRVYFEDTDAGGIVYHARYLHFLERARTEMMRCLTIPHAQMTADHGVLFAVRRCEIDYLSPARLDDSLEVMTRIVEIGGASLILDQQVRRTDEPLIRSLIRLACITAAGQVARIPLVIRQGLRQVAGDHGQEPRKAGHGPGPRVTKARTHVEGTEGHGPDDD